MKFNYIDNPHSQTKEIFNTFMRTFYIKNLDLKVYDSAAKPFVGFKKDMNLDSIESLEYKTD